MVYPKDRQRPRTRFSHVLEKTSLILGKKSGGLLTGRGSGVSPLMADIR